MTCIYFSVSLNVSKLEFKILGESYVCHFFYPASKSLAKVWKDTLQIRIWLHGEPGSRVCAPIANGRDEMRLRRDNSSDFTPPLLRSFLRFE